MRITDKIEITNEDCMELLKRTPDNYYSLALVDPPYGINIAKKGDGSKTLTKHKWKNHTKKEWDSKAPEKEYFDELFRVSKNQIIWGANYMTKYLPSSMGWIFWDKGQRDFSLADGELAFTSFQKALRVFTYTRGAQMAENTERFHPTQKPVALYKWLLDKYAKEGDKILDTHLGSMSIAIACHDYGFELTGCELDEEYYKKGIERIKNHVAQQKLF